MSPSKRLKPVHEIAVSSEETAGAALQAARRDLEQQLEQLRQLHAYQAEYQRRLSAGLTVSPAQLRDFHGFLRRLQEAVDQQGRLIDSLRRRCRDHETQWKRAHSRSQALDSVIGRYESREHREAERVEQKLCDEYALRLRRIRD